MVKCKESFEFNDLPGGGKCILMIEMPMVTMVLSSKASAIWEATARFQIRS
jgi:hypothetical protein